jgi:hypothetical protein
MRKRIMMKVETLEEYLARGGTIKKLTPVERVKETDVKSMAVGPAILLTLEEGDLFYGEKKKSKATKVLKAPTVDFDVLPEGLKEKLLAKAKNSKES